MSVQNPLLVDFSTKFETPPFDKIELSHYLPAVKEGIKLAKAEIEAIKTNSDKADFNNTFVALERSGGRLNRMSEIFFNLNSAETSDEMQHLAQEISPLLTAFSNDILLDEVLFERIKEAQKNTDISVLSAEEKTLLDKKVKAFERNGANLAEDKKVQLREIDEELSTLSLTFGKHVLAETNAFEMLLNSDDEIAGLPESVLEAAKEAAEAKGKEGYLFTLQYPSYVPFMTYSSNRALREKMYKIFSSRAFKGGETDNTDLVKRIAKLRYERANLLGYKTHADFVLENRMAEKAENVLSFLDELAEHAKPAAKRELETLKAFAKDLDGIEELQRWDITYYSEKLKKAKYEVDDELTKPYFRLEKVIDGVFEVANKLFGISFKKEDSIPVYHKDVQPYEVLDKDGSHLAVFFADFFPRAGKRDGAWMTSYRSQHLDAKGNQVRPHISIVCNFTKPTSKTPSLLTFREVTTLFHEFGHALHGMLANSTFESLSGTSVYWDFVELPSQVLENWAFEKECLDLFAHHYESGETISAELVEKLRKSANFMEGVATLRQLSFGFLDMAWHHADPTNIGDLSAFENDAMKKVSYLPEVAGSCMSTSFSHIFQGGYASGYYSYKWAEVLDADTFAYFQEKGIFNQDVASAFREHVLSAGGSEHPMTLYKRFRGSEPSIDALLKRAGLVEESAGV